MSPRGKALRWGPVLWHGEIRSWDPEFRTPLPLLLTASLVFAPREIKKEKKKYSARRDSLRKRE